MSLRHQLEARVQARFPRVSGDEPRQKRRVHRRRLFSPRERG